LTGGASVAVNVGTGVAVGTEGTTVEVGVVPDTVVGTGVAVNVGTGGTVTPLRTILGATHSARSPVGEPFASTLRMN
jgi:hypothetical protein